jgi:hypothetical protein
MLDIQRTEWHFSGIGTRGFFSFFAGFSAMFSSNFNLCRFKCLRRPETHSGSIPSPAA